MSNNDIGDFQAQVKAAQSAILHFEQLPQETVRPFSGGSELAQVEAEKVLAQPAAKERICAGLQSISSDLDKITEKVTEELWVMALAGTLLIPQNPFIYGWIGIIVYRATVQSFCVEFHDKE